MDRAEVAGLIREELARSSWVILVRALGERLRSGVGSPAGVVVAPPGTIYINLSGGAATTLYIKESGTGTAGWVAK